MELSTLAFPDFVKLAKILWFRGHDSVKNAARNSGFVRVTPIEKGTGNTREFSEVDTNEYLTYKGESDQAARGKAQQGLILALIKSLLINGETLIVKAKTTLSKLVRQIKNCLMRQLQRLSEETLFISEATVWSA